MIRWGCLLCSVFFNVFALAQNSAIFKIDSFPKQGIVLDQHWKWHQGDNPEWAKVDFDDSNWESIDPSQDIGDLPEIRKAAHGWLRLKLKVDTSLRNQIVGIMINQVVASEVYLQGE